MNILKKTVFATRSNQLMDLENSEAALARSLPGVAGWRRFVRRRDDCSAGKLVTCADNVLNVARADENKFFFFTHRIRAAVLFLWIKLKVHPEG